MLHENLPPDGFMASHKEMLEKHTEWLRCNPDYRKYALWCLSPSKREQYGIVRLSDCLFVCLSVCLSVWLSGCLSVACSFPLV